MGGTSCRGTSASQNAYKKSTSSAPSKAINAKENDIYATPHTGTCKFEMSGIKVRLVSENICFLSSKIFFLPLQSAAPFIPNDLVGRTERDILA